MVVNEQGKVRGLVFLPQVNPRLTMAKSVCSFLGGQPCRACRIPRVDRDTHVMNADEARALISGPLSNHCRIQPQQRAAIEHVTGEQVKPASLQMVHQ